MPLPIKPVVRVSSTRRDIQTFPAEVRRAFGNALGEAQKGNKHPHAKPLLGFGGASVLEVVDNFASDTYRAIYTVRFEEAIYVLHIFQKKSTQGQKTSLHDLEVVRTRLKQALLLHEEFLQQQKGNTNGL
jgi:phage-related protein